MNRIFFYFLASILLITSCNKDREKVYNVPSDIQAYIDDFVQEAANRGIELVVDDLTVEYMTDLELDGQEAAGLCYSETSDAPPTIHLDTFSLNWQSPYTREVLVFHELGHCVLGRGHTSQLLPNCNFASIMKPSGDPIYTSINLFKRDYYLDELFLESSSEFPDWSYTHLKPYDEFSDADKVVMFEDYFDNNSNGWPTNATNFSGSVENGVYTMDITNDDDFFLSTLELNFTQDITDFEIETSIKILEGGVDVVGIIWGDFTNDNAWMYGINAEGDGLIGLFGKNETVSNPYPNFKSNDFNKMTIRRIDGMYYFYFNEKLVDSADYIPYQSDNYRLFVVQNNKVEFDYFKISRFQ